MASIWFWVRIGSQVIFAALVATSWALESNEVTALSVEGKTLDWWIVGAIAILIYLALSLYSQIRQERRLDRRNEYSRTLKVLSADIASGHELLEECGRPDADYRDAPPMHFMQYCIPKILSWHSQTAIHVSADAPDFMGKYQSTGNVTYGTDEKKAMIQALEAHLQQLEWITDKLRDMAQTT